jgi:glutathione S-transferase
MPSFSSTSTIIHPFISIISIINIAEGGMTLYCKAAEDKVSVGDCPFAHFVRLVLEEKSLEYELKPTAPDGKPEWLVEYYDGKMPALRHRKECYVESSVIGSYVEYFFPEPSLTPNKDEKQCAEKAETLLDGFFPTVAKYLKDTQDSDATLTPLKTKLQQLEDHLKELPDDGSFLCGSQHFTLLDCRIVPQLYHLQVGIEGYKGGKPDLETEYPSLKKYMDRCFERESFQNTVYPKDVVLWGWGNARQ